MARHFDIGAGNSRLVVASHNEGKVGEIRDLLAPFGVETVSASELGLPDPEETGDTFIANAELKALAATKASGIVALADDSGLIVDALMGAPGIFTARWAGEPRDFAVAMRKVEQELHDKGAHEPGDRRASFVAALSLAWPDGHMETVEGRVAGHLIWPPRGDKGFGYDPVFVPDGYDMTFGEMEGADKLAISHRAIAFQKLIERCFAA